jgi:hypothetical protein
VPARSTALVGSVSNAGASEVCGDEGVAPYSVRPPDTWSVSHGLLPVTPGRRCAASLASRGQIMTLEIMRFRRSTVGRVGLEPTTDGL